MRLFSCPAVTCLEYWRSTFPHEHCTKDDRRGCTDDHESKLDLSLDSYPRTKKLIQLAEYTSDAYMSREFLALSYDRANESTDRALASIPEGDFNRGLDYPDWDPMLTGEVTLERLFRYLKLHFEHHAAEIRDQLKFD